jgi:hypothetical protein
MGELQQEQQEQFDDAEPAAAAAADGSSSDQAAAAGSEPAGASSSPQQQQAAAAEEGEEEEDDSECLDGYDGGRMSSIERQLLVSSLALVAAATGTLKAFGMALLQVCCGAKFVSVTRARYCTWAGVQDSFSIGVVHAAFCRQQWFAFRCGCCSLSGHQPLKPSVIKHSHNALPCPNRALLPIYALYTFQRAAIMQGSELLAGTEALDSWESCLFHSRHLKRAVEDLGAAMFPPQVGRVDRLLVVWLVQNIAEPTRRCQSLRC